ncbi:MAG: DJ-1/PfpI family protein [Syntrophorhabdaceae bacterium]|nr:DJ-1/PfpI family protein [Syntrophorhabdaceae bacterium]MDD5244973.1 DJ-1/PfpI family protein [Syntrophorhabdaceae bacterium]
MDTDIIRIIILLYDRFTALDAIGPYEVLSRLPGSKIYFTGYEKRKYKDTYGLELKADYSINEISEAEILLIPGGFGIDNFLKNREIIDWVRKIDRTTSWTVAVCSGSLLLAEAGILDGKNCTTHWRRKEQLRQYNVHIKDDRFVQDGKVITSAGVSAGIDMALYLVSKVAGDDAAKIIQLGMEYDPQPPFDCGSPGKAPPEILERFKK